ncbi:hypothetical protein RHSIM_Rhsim01G0015200 [Rhododendron simsii]|uniref:F-box/LRR-repeat protein 15-like leucin rich repeat domain-containing protein n=1 Tax=Rhododendron simsii TaxID=118357 RepID=A0A834HFP7_RHOSS|nr:hypothetical protein RHSIM_Rhsim01G0015200 [Rhododendron simsii]
MKKQRSGPSAGYYFPDDCWEFIFRKLREEDERDLDSISLVSKRFLSISNRVKLSLNIHDKTLPLLPNLVRRFGHIETIVIDSSYKKVQDIDGLVDQISRSGVLNLQAMKFPWWSTKLPRDDCFPRLEELRIRADKDSFFKGNDEVPGHITDDGVDALASKLKELKGIVFEGDACFITDQSLISLSTNCVKLRSISLSLCSFDQHRVTGDGISFVMRHSPNLTSLSLVMWSLQLSVFSFSMDDAFANAKNLHSLTMSRDLISDKLFCLVAKARPPLKKLKLSCFMGQNSEIHGALKMLLQAYQLTLEELTLQGWPLPDTVMGDLAQYLYNLTSIDFYGPLGWTSFTFYTLTKSCPLLEILKMTHTGRQEMDLFCPDYSHKNQHMRHLDISRNMWFTDMMLKNFGQVCPNLQFLDVSGCMRLTNFAIRKVLRRCPAITQLNINCLNISDVFGSYSDHCVVKLKTLKAQETQIDDKGMAMIGKRCRNLQYLDIRCCKKVTDKGVMEVVRSCARLRKVSSNILPQMAFSRPSLRNIDPPSCDGLSEKIINTVLSLGCRI